MMSIESFELYNNR